MRNQVVADMAKKAKTQVARPDRTGKKPIKLRKFRGYKELVHDPYNLGI